VGCWNERGHAVLAVGSTTSLLNMNNWCVYLVQCSDGSLYCGATNNVQKRIATHNTGKGAKYTRVRRPLVLLAVSKQMLKSDALKLEHQVKKQKREKKIQYLKEAN
jgi:putative endonuclease